MGANGLSLLMAVRRFEHLASRARSVAEPIPINEAPRRMAFGWESCREVELESCREAGKGPSRVKRGFGDNLGLSDIKLKADFGTLLTKEVDV